MNTQQTLVDFEPTASDGTRFDIPASSKDPSCAEMAEKMVQRPTGVSTKQESRSEARQFYSGPLSLARPLAT